MSDDLFDFNAPPFHALTQKERRRVQEHAVRLDFDAGQTIVGDDAALQQLHLVLRGEVQQYDGDTPRGSRGAGESFDLRALVAGGVAGRWVATTPVRTWTVAWPEIQRLLRRNAGFAAGLFADAARCLTGSAGHEGTGELQALSLARVRDAPLRPALVVDAGTDVVSVVRLFRQHDRNSVLVRDRATSPPRLGMFTSSALQEAVLDGTPLQQLPVGRLARYPLITVAVDDQVGDALVRMLRHDIHRVVVMDGDAVRGVLESLDVFSFLADHSHLIATRIAQADGLAELAAAAAQITALIARQYRAGMRVALLAHLVQELNARLFDRAWRLIAPADLVAGSCLFVMGSEGRGEQLLRTDQDNGLVLRDDYAPPADLAAICQRFSDALARFGYPECPGGIMLSRPDWRGSVSGFGRRVRRWLIVPEGDSLMNLAIFMDAHAVSGDADLLAQVRASLYRIATDNDAVLARFAAAVDAFGGRSGWWNRLRGDVGQRLNLKKEGIFALVHGVRALALAHRLPEIGSAARISALVRVGELTAEDGRQLTDALHFLMALRLQGGLAERERGEPVSGAVDVRTLPAHERERLKATLAVVRRFKAVLRHRFRLDTL